MAENTTASATAKPAAAKKTWLQWMFTIAGMALALYVFLLVVGTVFLQMISDAFSQTMRNFVIFIQRFAAELAAVTANGGMLVRQIGMVIFGVILFFLFVKLMFRLFAKGKETIDRM